MAHHLQHGHIVRIKRGLFAVIPYGANPDTYPINPYLITSALTQDAVVAYHSALAFYGLAYSVSYRFIYLTKTKPKDFEFRETTYQPTLFSTILISKGKMHCYTNKEDVQGINILVTSKERTLVDVLDRPLLGGGLEEIWRSLDAIDRIKVKDVIDYVLLLENATTIAKVGFYLEQRKEALNISEESLKLLEPFRPTSPRYMDETNTEKYRLISRWNLMVPQSLIQRDWEEELPGKGKL